MAAQRPPGSAGGPPGVAVLLKRVDLRAVVDPLSGEVVHDIHGGLSAADECALELALRQAERSGTALRAVSAGPPECEAVLRVALGAGAAEAVRVAMPADTPSAHVASALADAVAGCGWVWAGDYSLDRGSGSVPAFVAGRLGAAQCLGLSAVDLPASGGGAGERGVLATRRLDGGRRESVRVRAPAVLSVESGLARLRRPGLRAALRAGTEEVRQRDAPTSFGPPVGRVRPFRPRPRVLLGPDPALPARQRVVALSGALVEHDPPRLVHAGPEVAADELLAFLRQRGYLDDGVVAVTGPASS